MRTLHHMPEDKRLRISEETMDIYAPLAGRMGMQDMREELEQLAFRYINPEAFNAVTNRLAELMERNKATLKTDRNRSFQPVRTTRRQGQCQKPAEESLVGVPQDGDARAFPSNSYRTFSGFGSSWIQLPIATTRSVSFTRPGRWFRDGSRTISRHRSRTITVQFIRPSLGHPASASNCRSAPVR